MRFFFHLLFSTILQFLFFFWHFPQPIVASIISFQFYPNIFVESLKIFLNKLQFVITYCSQFDIIAFVGKIMNQWSVALDYYCLGFRIDRMLNSTECMLKKPMGFSVFNCSVCAICFVMAFEFLKFLLSVFVVVISTRKHSHYVYISFLMSAECNLTLCVIQVKLNCLGKKYYEVNV